MISLPEAPVRIARLPKDERGYPVPYFVMWFRGGRPAPRSSPGAQPDFRYADQGFRYLAFKPDE